MTRLGLAKNFKVAGTTLTEILIRLAYLSNWRIERATVETESHVQLETNSVRPCMGVIPNNQVNLFVQESRWNESQARDFLGPDAKFITILRDPPDQFESMFSFIDMRAFYNVSSIHELLSQINRSEVRTDRLFDTFGRNQMLWTLGFPNDQFDNFTAVATFVDELKEKFELVLISEYLDESLVLLKQLLNVPLAHLVYTNLNERSDSSKDRLTIEEKRILRQWLEADVYLYETFRKLLRRKITKLVRDETELLRRANSKLKSFCKVVVVESNQLGKPEERFGLLKVKLSETIRSKLLCNYHGTDGPRFGKEAMETAQLVQNIFATV